MSGIPCRRDAPLPHASAADRFRRRFPPAVLDPPAHTAEDSLLRLSLGRAAAWLTALHFREEAGLPAGRSKPPVRSVPRPDVALRLGIQEVRQLVSRRVTRRLITALTVGLLCGAAFAVGAIGPRAGRCDVFAGEIAPGSVALTLEQGEQIERCWAWTGGPSAQTSEPPG